MNKFFLFFVFLGLAGSGFAQKGNIRGVVIEDESGEPLIGVTLLVKGTSIGAISDFDGKFDISIDEGNYDLQVSFVSFETVVISGIEVEAGKVAYFNNIRLKEAVQQLEAVVVTAELMRNSEEALLTLKKKAPNLMDGISSASFQKIGDSDASEAIKRVTGVSIEGGKYIYVRGLGDRYTKTMSNGMEIPGLDPDMNSLQIDIFPTNLLDNLVVLKTALAEYPADFTGGLVNIETKDFPEEKLLNVSFGAGYNPSMHFNRNYLKYEGSNTDWLGYDDGSRALPSLARQSALPTPVNRDYSAEEVNQFVRSFNPTLGPVQQKNFMDYNFGFSLGNQKRFDNGHSLGYSLSATYKHTTEMFDDVVYGEYQRPGTPTDYELVYAYVQEGVLTRESVLLGGLGGLAYKTSQSKFKLSLMHLQNGVSQAGLFFIDDNGTAVGKSGYTADSYNIDYNQRSLSNLLLSGEHHLPNSTWSVVWKISPTLSRLTDPDIRKTAFTLNSGRPAFEAGNGGIPSRIWRNLDEINLANRLDVTKSTTFFDREAKIKLGMSYLFKERDYEILFFDLQRFGSAPILDGDPNNVLISDNIYPEGVYYYQSGNSDPNPNEYNSNVNNLAAYISSEFNASASLKAIVGLRVENYVQRHTGRDQEFASSGVGQNLEDEKVLDSFDFFPSLNMIYSLSDRQNLRLSYSRTIARPSFKELSYAQILDPISNRTFNGGLFAFTDGEGNVIWDGNLTEARINNVDLRWELFMSKSQIISLSAFYKTFERPIELVRIPAAQTGLEFQPRNVGNGQVLGAEIEFRKSLDFVAPVLRNFSLNGNLTMVKSSIDMTDTEFDARKVFEKDRETIDKTREMAGQAPYIINAGFTYENVDIGFDWGLFYNVKGPTLILVGGGLTPDVYSEPFHALNFNLNKTIGKEKRATINFGVNNILNDVREEFFTGFNAADQYYSRMGPGTSYSLGLKYSIF